MTQNLRVQELDFDTIKQNLKEFLRGKPEFTDYDFEGSGMSALLNVLAYNTHYNAVLANMQMNELFLDTATKRVTAALHASRLGYVPKSMTAATAKVNLEIFPGNATPATLTIGKNAIFTTSISGDTYSFVTTEARTVARSSSGRYLFTDLEVKEGVFKTFRYNYVVANPVRFVIPSKNVDISTLTVKVQTSTSNTAYSVFDYSKTIADHTRDSSVYYLKVNQAGYYEVFFGDNVISKNISNGNVVILEYLETNGDAANGASKFVFADTVQGYSSNLVTTTVSAYGGAPQETADQIKVSAQAAHMTQNRAVTEADYRAAINEIYPAESISVWGGEKNDPPIYGRVFICVKPTGGGTLTETTKQDLSSALIKSKSVLTIVPEFVDPEYTFVKIDSAVYYDSALTEYSASSLSTLVSNSIVEYSNENLGKFENVLRFSKLCGKIDSTSQAIQSNITNLKLYKIISPSDLVYSKKTIIFGNPIVPGSVYNDGIKIAGNTNTLYMEDLDGKLRLYYVDGASRKYVSLDAGDVFYSSGKIVINPLVITSIEDFKLFVTPNSNDIFSVRENIIMLNPSDISINVIRDSSDASTHIFTSSR